MSKPQPSAGASGRRKDDHDLTTILDDSQHEELTFLIADITESMRQLILDNFSATAGLDKSLLKEGMSEDEKIMSADPSADVSKYDQERKLKEANEKDLATLKMQNLKKNSLKAFDQWREDVNRRVAEAVNQQKAPKRQLKRTNSTSVASPQAPDTAGKIVEGSRRSSNLKFRDLFWPTKTPLTKLPMDKRTLILHSVLLLLLSLEHYTAPSRILLLNLTSSLKLPLRTFEQDEYTTAKGLLEAAREMTASEELKKKAEENKDNRNWRVGLATAAGAAILGVTGGLAAPLVAAGVGSVMGGLGLGATAAAGYLGSVAGSTILVGSLFGAYGGRMTGQMMDNYAREVEDFEFLPVHSQNKTSEDEKTGAQQASDHDHKLRVIICISGWLTEKDEVSKPWRVLGNAAEVFALKYELESLLKLGHAMDSMMTSAAWGYAQKELIAQTIFADLAAAMWPIGLMKVARVVDNPFSVAKGRAEKAGEVLADALINKAQGERPVTLIGYSLGARVIYTCLKSLAKRKAFGLIESVVMMGSPTPSDTSDWRLLRSVVTGRLVNVYSENDYILGFMYRTSAIQYGIAGLQKVEGLAGVENFDATEDVKAHTKYRFLIGSILRKIGFEDINMEAVEEEYRALLKIEDEEKKQSLQAQRNRLLRRQSNGGNEDEAAEAEQEASEMEKKVQDSTQKSLMTRAIEYFYTPSVPNSKDAEKISKNVQKAVEDPSQVYAAATDSAKDVQVSTDSYAQWVSKKLPSMPGMSAQKSTSGPGAVATSAGDKAKQPASQIVAAGKSATQQTSSYFPNMPKNLPSIQSLSKNLPSMPSLPQRGKQSTTSKAADTTKQTASTATSTAKAGASATTDAVKTTVTNVSQPQNNPAVGAASKTVDAIKESASTATSAAKAGGAATTDALKTTAMNISQPQNNPAVGAARDMAKNAPVIHQASEQVSKNIPRPTTSKQSDGQDQTYMSKATSYLPSMSSMQMPSFSSTAKTKTDAEKKTPPKLDRKSSDANKVTMSPKPQPSRTPSGLKSPPPKLEKRASGIKSPPPKLDRVPSGLKSPPMNAAKQVSGGVQQGGQMASQAAGGLMKSVPGLGGK